MEHQRFGPPALLGQEHHQGPVAVLTIGVHAQHRAQQRFLVPVLAALTMQLGAPSGHPAGAVILGQVVALAERGPCGEGPERLGQPWL
jgi:hypothetical protein